MMKNNPENIEAPTNGCERKEDLVGYLYGEIGAAERDSFERHLTECGSCGDELKAFGRVRDDLGAWQVGFMPQTAFETPRTRWDVMKELLGMFPFWARGAALAAMALVIAFLTFGASQMLRSQSENRLSTAQIESLVQDAVARERTKLQVEFRTELAGFKAGLDADHDARIRELKAVQEQQIKSLQAGFQAELRKVNRQNSSIRSFFAMGDNQDPWGGAQ